MNKSRCLLRSIVSSIFVFALAGFFVVGAFAASTVGTNMSTTGTFLVNPASDSATSVRFQNAAGTNYFVANSTNKWVGVGAAPQTTFEVQGTSSASYFLTGNTIQVGGFASVAYSRFGTNATTYSGDLSTTNDLLISGNLEVDLKAYFDNPAEFQGTASASYFLTGNTIQVGGFASVAYSRFGTNATTHAGTVSGTSDLLVSGGFEVNGSAAFDGFALFSAKASVTTDFEAQGYASATDAFISRDLIVGGGKIASSSAKYVAEFGGGNNTATVSLLFGGNAASSAGTCFQMKNTQGVWVYLRIKGTASATLDINTSPCHE